MKKFLAFAFVSLLTLGQMWGADWSAGKTVYFDNSLTNWEKVYIIIGHNSYSRAYEMAKVDGTQNLYFYTMSNQWGGYTKFVVASDCGSTTTGGGSTKIETAYSTCASRINSISDAVSADVLIQVTGASSPYSRTTTTDFDIEEFKVVPSANALAVLNETGVMFYYGSPTNWGTSNTLYFRENSGTGSTLLSSKGKTINNMYLTTGCYNLDASHEYYLSNSSGWEGNKKTGLKVGCSADMSGSVTQMTGAFAFTTTAYMVDVNATEFAPDATSTLVSGAGTNLNTIAYYYKDGPAEWQKLDPSDIAALTTVAGKVYTIAALASDGNILVKANNEATLTVQDGDKLLLTYLANGATSGTAPEAVTEIVPGTNVTIVGNTGSLEKTGYAFGGWNTKADGTGVDYAVGASVVMDENLQLFAKWTPITYSIQFNANAEDATGTMAAIENVVYGTPVTLTANAYEREGFIFKGWAAEGDKTKVLYTDGAQVMSLASTQGAVVNLYAVWGGTITVYFWNTFDWTEVDVHCWDGTKPSTSWPGTKLDAPVQYSDGHGVYAFSFFEGDYGKLIFNNNNGKQTNDLENIASQNGKCYRLTNENDRTGEWIALPEPGPEPEPEPTINYYLVGTLTENGWDASKAMPMTDDQITRSVAAGTYEFKVLKALGSWDGALGYNDVNAECSSEGYEQNGTNVKVTLVNDGDVTVAIVNGKICVTGEFGEATITVYTIAGEADLMGSGWNAADANNDMTWNEEQGVWTLTKHDVTLAKKDYQYKVVANHAWGVADFPASGNNVLSCTSATTADVTFTWNPTTQELTATIEGQTPASGWMFKSSVDNWEVHAFEKKEGETSETIEYYTMTINEAKTYEGGVEKSGTYRYKNSGTYTRNSADQEQWWILADGEGSNWHFTADKTGDYTFAIDYADANAPKIRVYYPEDVMVDVTLSAGEHGSIAGETTVSAGEFTPATISATADEHYVLRQWEASEGITLANSRASNTTITATQAGTVTASFRPEWDLRGSFNEWTDANPFVTFEGNVASVKVNLEACNTYGFKIKQNDEGDGKWYGNNGTITKHISGWTFSTEEGNCYIDATVTGEYTFRLNIETMKLDVVYPRVELTISWVGWATYYGELDLEIPAGIEALYITGIEGGNIQWAALTDVIPAKTGVVLHGAAGTYVAAEAEGTESAEGNLLLGSTEATTIDNEHVHYVLSCQTDGSQVGLYWPNDATVDDQTGVGPFLCGAHRAYLELNAGADAPRRFIFGQVTLPTDVQANRELRATKVLRNGHIYILRGERVYDVLGR